MLYKVTKQIAKNKFRYVGASVTNGIFTSHLFHTPFLYLYLSMSNIGRHSIRPYPIMAERFIHKPTVHNG